MEHVRAHGCMEVDESAWRYMRVTRVHPLHQPFHERTSLDHVSRARGKFDGSYNYCYSCCWCVCCCYFQLSDYPRISIIRSCKEPFVSPVGHFGADITLRSSKVWSSMWYVVKICEIIVTVESFSTPGSGSIFAVESTMDLPVIKERSRTADTTF